MKRRATLSQCIEFYSDASEAAFLFDKVVQDKIEEIFAKSFKLAEKYDQLYPEDESPGLSPGEERSKISQENSELFSWHVEENKTIKLLFTDQMRIQS